MNIQESLCRNLTAGNVVFASLVRCPHKKVKVIPIGATKVTGGTDVQLHAFLNSVLDGGE